MTLSQKYPKQNRTGRVVQVVECHQKRNKRESHSNSIQQFFPKQRSNAGV
jgi:hypothetical protein